MTLDWTINSSVVVSYTIIQTTHGGVQNANLNFISKFILSNNFLTFLTDFHPRE